MNRFLSVLFLLVISFLTFSCGHSNSVEVKDFSPTGEVDKLTTFKVEFSKNLAPADKQDKWLSDEFIEFEPKIPGKFKWVDASTLIFSPEAALAPIQNYTARITKKVLFNTVYTLDYDEYKFHTAQFGVTSVDFFWMQIPNKNYKLSVQANIHFNYPVNPDQLKQYLEVTKDDEKINDFEIVSTKSSDVIAVNFGEVSQTDKEQDVKIIIKSGLESVVGKKSLEDSKTFEKELPPITELTITGVGSGYDGKTGWITVGTSQMVDEKKLADFVSVDPPMELHFFVYENQFRIEGDFANSQNLNLKIKKGLPGLYGGDLKYVFEQMVSLVSLKPTINFADQSGKYLMLNGNKNIEANIVNIEEADFEVSQVFKNNLVLFLNRNTYSYNRNNYGYSPYFNAGDFGTPLYNEKIKLSVNQNWLQKVTLNLDKAISNKQKGIYLVSLRSNKERWVQDSKIIAISDLGIIAKKSKNELIVFVNSIKRAEPVSGVNVEVISKNNQTLLSGTTDSKGAVIFSDTQADIEKFKPTLITAEKSNDFNYIDLRETKVGTSRFDVGGLNEVSSTYQTFLYGDRNLYRPGDKVILSGIIRDSKMNVVKDIPIIIKVISPTGKIFDEFKKTLNEEGSYELSFDMPQYSLTGEYNAEVYVGNTELIGNYKFSVEDFVPDKIRVSLKNDKEKAFPGETVKINVDAEYLYGAKASNAKYEADIQLRNQPFISKTYPTYDFTKSTAANNKIQNTTLNGNLNDSGKAVIKYIVPNDLSGAGIIKGYAFTSIFDLTGRPVNRVSTFDVFPKKYFIGIKAPGYYFATNEKLNFQLAAVDDNDKPLKDFDGIVQLVRFEWQTVLKKDYRDIYYYDSEEKENIEWEKEITIKNGQFSFPFILSKSGKYQIRVAKKGSEDDGFVYKEFYAFGWGSSTASSFEVDKEGRIDIVFSKKIYEPGEVARILFTTPFSGKMLITFERDGVYDYQIVDVDKKSHEINVRVKDLFMPNVYVTATLFRPHSADNKAPFLVGHGFASMKVEKKSNKLPVKIEAPKKIRPNTKQKITVKTKPEENIFITVAAVDEGILQIKNYSTPDPYGYMYAKRSLATSSYDLYKLLLPEIVKQSSSTGGDKLAAALQKRANPVTTKRFKLFSYWSGIRRTDSNGEVSVDLDIPQFNGELRLMAVAYAGKRFGNVDKPIKVADDLIIEPEIPRFLSVGDSLIMPVTIINTTDKNENVDLSVDVSNILKLKSKNIVSLTIDANSTASASFILATKKIAGKAKIILNARGSKNVKNEIDIAVRPSSPFITQTGEGIIKAGTTTNLQIPGNFLSGTQSSSLTLSKFPVVKFAEQLKYLVGYPYGCLEQTVSKLFPQLYFEDLAKMVAPELYKTNNPVYFVKEGIRKIESMQLYNGSLAYWQGGTYSNWWSNVYAANFLLEAKKAGYIVSENVLSNLLSYLTTKVRSKSLTDYYTYSGTRRTVQKIANKEIIYSLYVLALAGQGDISTMNYYKARPYLLTSDTKYLLAGAYGLMGKWNSYSQIIPETFIPVKVKRATGGDFDSEIRANAIMLNVLLEVDPTNQQIQSIVRYLSKRTNEMYSTQERSFAFLALGKAASINEKADVKVDVYSGDKKIAEYNGNDLSIDNNISGAELKLKAAGSGEIYYFWSTEGVKLDKKVKEEDSYMSVRRKYYDYKSGRLLTSKKFSQGQLILAKISLTGYERSADNIVITDMIPSGFEIENQRLSNVSRLNIQKDKMNVQFDDIRDDRMILFTELKSNETKSFYYLLRVINKGEFVLPPVGAEAMYDKEFHSYNGAGKVIVN